MIIGASHSLFDDFKIGDGIVNISRRADGYLRWHPRSRRIRYSTTCPETDIPKRSSRADPFRATFEKRSDARPP